MKYIYLSSSYDQNVYVLKPINNIDIDQIELIKNYDEITINSTISDKLLLNKLSNLNINCVINIKNYKISISKNVKTVLH